MLDQTHLIASIQATVIYEILLLLPSKTSPEIPFVEPYIFSSIAKLVYYVAVNGMAHAEERTHTMPQWKDLINVNSKRRSTLALYLLHRAYTVYHGLPSTTCREMAFLPAITAKVPWQARRKEEWELLCS
jgi:hypothetical protein